MNVSLAFSSSSFAFGSWVAPSAKSFFFGLPQCLFGNLTLAPKTSLKKFRSVGGTVIHSRITPITVSLSAKLPELTRQELTLDQSMASSANENKISHRTTGKSL
jgi:hypothetical protein